MLRHGLLAATLLVTLPARASVFDFLSDALMSQPMPRPPGDVRGEPTRTVVLNGFTLYVTTGRTTRPVKDLLDYYQERYPGGVLKEMMGRPVGVRRDGDTTGTLMVVEVASRAAAQEIMDGKRTLVSAGPLRMVYARRSGMYTDYLMAWSDRPMPQSVLQPRQSGDAPGEDLKDVPRPMGGTRSFSFYEPKAGYQLATYVVDESPDAALRRAAGLLAASGWQEDTQFGLAAQKRQKLVARFSKGRRDVVVTARTVQGERGTQLGYLTRDL